MLRITPSSISCGVVQLYGLGGDLGDYPNYTPTKTEFLELLKTNWKTTIPRCCYIIASVNHRQVKGLAFLLEVGFKQITEWRCNPNSNNNVAVFAFDVWPDVIAKV